MADRRGLILNVDDYEASRYARSQMLKRAGFRGAGGRHRRGGAPPRERRGTGPRAPRRQLAGHGRLRGVPPAAGAAAHADRAHRAHLGHVPERPSGAAGLRGRRGQLSHRPGRAGGAAGHHPLAAAAAPRGGGAAGGQPRVAGHLRRHRRRHLPARRRTARSARCNAAFATLLDRAPADLVGRPWAEIWRRLGGAEEPSPTARVERTRRRETFDLQREQGWFRLLVDPVLEGESVTGLVCIVTDVTIERQAAEVRAALFAREQEAREEAEASNRAKDEFLAMLGHELRNPLDAIATAVGCSTGRRRAAGRADAPARARSSRARSRHLARLVDDLLDVGARHHGQDRAAQGPVDLAERWRARVARPALPRRGSTRRTGSRHGPSRSGSRPTRRALEQIVDEPPVNNALKYTPAGGAHRRRRRARRRRGGAARAGHRRRA